MKILIASDKFKGSMTAFEACQAITDGLLVGDSNEEVRQIPLSDGGDGMAKVLTETVKGHWVEVDVTDSLGNPLRAGYGIIEDGQIAVIEMAEASGLARLDMAPQDPDLGRRYPADKSQIDPWRASTRGTGEMILDAINRGVKKILLGIGGSATNDAGAGMAEALGYRFFDEEGTEIKGLPLGLERVASIIPPEGIDSFPEVVVACDVSNPLLGDNGATRVYGPQKGIAPADFEKHEARLKNLVKVSECDIFAAQPGSGAAGGLGFGALVFLRAKLEPGFDVVAQYLDLETHVKWADLVITGEGKIDLQSLQGKAPSGVALLGRKHRKPVFAFCGLLDDVDLKGAFAKVFEIDSQGHTLAESIQNGPKFLTATVKLKKAELLDTYRRSGL